MTEDLITAVREELAVAAPDTPAHAPADAELTADLGVDSLSVLELVARLEYRFGVVVPDEDWARMRSIAAIADYLAHALVHS